jgi:hypothetical protein
MFKIRYFFDSAESAFNPNLWGFSAEVEYQMKASLESRKNSVNLN